jgi:hypothetical protein
MVDHMAHRAELKAKVEQRQAELQQALAAAESAGHSEQRIDGLRVALRIAEDAMQNGVISEVAAVTLSKWLETTHTLTLPHAQESEKAEESEEAEVASPEAGPEAEASPQA